MISKAYKFLVVVLVMHTTNVLAQNVGIGESAPVQKLQVNDDAVGTLTTIRIEDCATGKEGDYGSTSRQTNSTAPALSAPLAGQAKTVYADGNGDLFARYVYGDNIQNVNPKSDYNLVAVTTTILQGMTITFTPRHSIVYLTYSFSGANNLAGANNSVGGWVTAQAYLNGTALQGTGTASGPLKVYSAADATEYSAYGLSANMIPVSVTPGVPLTIDIRYYANPSTGETVYCNPTSNASFCHRNMTILD